MPVTVCTDLLRPGGYARARGYLDALGDRMDAAGAASIPEFIGRAFGPASNDVCASTELYVDRASSDARYTQAANSRTPRKIGRMLQLFDCISCDKCVPVCPNDANFTFVLPRTPMPIVKGQKVQGSWRWSREGAIAIDEPHQIGTFADFCNECGNCDVFCPEDGGPYLLKPRVFGSEEAWSAVPRLDGFFLERTRERDRILGRFAGEDYGLDLRADVVTYTGPGFGVAFRESDPTGTIEGEAEGVVDLTYFEIMNALRRALFAPPVNYVNALGDQTRS